MAPPVHEKDAPAAWRRYAPQIAIAFGVAALAAGCANTPAGAPTTPNALNRLGVSMTLQAPLNTAYYYDFAFDDNGVSADGPAALVGATFLPNGVVGGSFSVLVQYHAGQFIVYHRTLSAAGAETLDRATNAFVTPPGSQNGRTISFTLDLNATTDSGVRLFRADAQRLDTNFVTTNDVKRDANDNRLRAFDALGNEPGAANQWFTFDVRGTRTYTNADVGEPAGDVSGGDTSGAVDVDQLDIVDLNIDVQRAQ